MCQEQEVCIVRPMPQQQQQSQQLLGAVPIGGDDRGPQFDTHVEDPEATPHARGPAILGVEDLGLQDGKGVQMSLSGISGSVSTVSGITATDLRGTVPVSPNRKPERDNPTRNPDRDADGDIVFRDAERKGGGIEGADDAIVAAVPVPAAEGESTSKSGAQSEPDRGVGAPNGGAADDVKMDT